MTLFLITFALAASLDVDISRLEKEINLRPQVLIVRETLADKYSQKHDYDKVISLLDPFIDRAPQKSLLLLASAYRAKKDYENEIRVLKLVAEKNETNPKFFYLLGIAQMNAKKENEGIASFRHSLELNENFKIAADALREYFLKIDARYEARELILSMIKKFGPAPAYLNDLCKLYAADGFGVDAVKQCEKAIQKSPQLPDNYVYQAQSYYDSDQSQKAEQILTKSADQFAKSEFVLWAAGSLYLKKNLYPVAAKYFKKAILADPNSPRSLVGLGQAELQNGHFSESYDSYFKACSLDIKMVESFQDGTATLRQKGNETWARKFNQGSYSCRPKAAASRQQR